MAGLLPVLDENREEQAGEPTAEPTGNHLGPGRVRFSVQSYSFSSAGASTPLRLGKPNPDRCISLEKP